MVFFRPTDPKSENAFNDKQRKKEDGIIWFLFMSEKKKWLAYLAHLHHLQG